MHHRCLTRASRPHCTQISIPLRIAEIPSAGEFRDAISSLSPEQARFASAFRAMQLESTLFAVLVVQIKPQLETLLNLAANALTKEVELTQSLMELFIKYQIPADLLSAPREEDGSNGSASSRLAAVKAAVAAIYDMISKAENKELKHREMEELAAAPLQPPERPQSKMMMNGGGARVRGPMMRSMAAMGANMVEGFSPMNAPDIPQAYALSFDAVPQAAPAMLMSRASALPAPAAVSAGASEAAVYKSAPASASSPPQPHQANVTVAAGGAGGAIDSSNSAVDGDAPRDLTQLPSQLDKQYDACSDGDALSAVRATRLTPDGPWVKRAQEGLLAKQLTTSVLDGDAQGSARSAAFDLIDAISRSGALPLEHAALHVVVGATLCFDESIIDCVVSANMNPIERSERAMLAMATTLHSDAHVSPAQLLRAEHVLRLTTGAGAVQPLAEQQ